VYDEGSVLDLATTSLDFVGAGVTAQSTGPGTVQVNVPLIDDYGRMSKDANQNIGGAAVTTVQFDYTWLDPNNRWDAATYSWFLPVGVYEIGTNITMENNPLEYAVRIVNLTNNGQILAIANSVAHQASDYEHTTHLSTIIELQDPSRIRIEVDTPYTVTCTINGLYVAYAPFDNIGGNRTLTDFWYHKLK
jgi:hypothetical protein